MFCLFKAALILHTEASSFELNNINPNTEEVEMMEIQNKSDNSDKYSHDNMVEINLKESVIKGKIPWILHLIQPLQYGCLWLIFIGNYQLKHV